MQPSSLNFLSILSVFPDHYLSLSLSLSQNDDETVLPSLPEEEPSGRKTSDNSEAVRIVGNLTIIDTGYRKLGT